MACEYNRRELFNEAVKRGVSPNELTSDGRNVLMVCFESGNDNLCIQITEDYSLSHLINQKNKVIAQIIDSSYSN